MRFRFGTHSLTLTPFVSLLPYTLKRHTHRIHSPLQKLILLSRNSLINSTLYGYGRRLLLVLLLLLLPSPVLLVPAGRFRTLAALVRRDGVLAGAQVLPGAHRPGASLPFALDVAVLEKKGENVLNLSFFTF